MAAAGRRKRGKCVTVIVCPPSPSPALSAPLPLLGGAGGGDTYADAGNALPPPSPLPEVGGGAIAAPANDLTWTPDATRELGKIPFFVRGKARRNTEKFAADRGLAAIDIDTLYEAKSHYAR